MTYPEKLKDPRWQKKRLSILNRDNFTCCICSDTQTELQVHHKSYIKGREPWDYDENNFQTLCRHCHMVTSSLVLKDAESIVASKMFKKEFNVTLVSTIINDIATGELSLSIDKIDSLWNLSNTLIIRQSTFNNFELLFQYSEKLISNAKQNTPGLDRFRNYGQP